ncbi:MAG: hypothetical protein ACRC8S_01075 [Fimbriiglobus sp.]
MPMFRSFLLIAALAILGCGQEERTIQSAKKVEEENPLTMTEIPNLPAPAQSSPEARALVQAALAAHTQGKTEAINSAKSFQFTRGGYILSNTLDQMPQSWTVKATWPRQFQVKAELNTPNGLTTMLLTWSGEAGWQQLLTPQVIPPVDLAKEAVRDYQLDISGEWILMLVPLLEPETVLDVAKSRKVREKSCPGVRVWHPVLTETIVYFDPDTKLIAHITTNGRENGRLVIKDFVPSDYKTISGIQYPAKLAIYANSKQLADWTYTSTSFTRHDPKVFVKP